MIHTLENSEIQLEINPMLGRWSAGGRHRNSPSLENIQINLNYKRGLSTHNCLDRWPGASISDPETIDSPHGPLQQIKVIIPAEENSIQCTLTFAMSTQEPILLWKISVENQSSEPIQIGVIEMLTAGYFYRQRSSPHGMIFFPTAKQPTPSSSRSEVLFRDLSFFSNGWQSWSYSGSYRAEDHYRWSRLGFLRTPLIQNQGTPHPRRAGSFASDMFGVLGETSLRRGILVGFISQKEHFGSLETWIGGGIPALSLWANGDNARLDPGEHMDTDWAYLQFLHLDNPDPLATYHQAVAREHDLVDYSSRKIHSPAGWCSWYQFSSEYNYTGSLTEEDILHNLEALEELHSELPLDIVQIDDGFQSQIGDWFTFDRGFPDGPGRSAIEIRERGFTPGIWLAPFILHPRSKLAREHRDWLLKGSFGRPINAGFIWGALTSALDLTHPEALAYVEELIQTAVSEWGFSYLKLDFLYAAALAGRRHDPTRTRAQVLRSGLESVRAAAGEDTFILGCGCPLGPAIGLVDSMRISPDTARRWRPSFSGREFFVRDESSLPSAFNAVHNSLTRAHLHRRWWINDPDCILLREATHLSLPEVETIATVIALSGGALLLSDHLPDLPPERLNIAMRLLPLIEKRPYILDWFDNPTPERVQLDLSGPIGNWHLVALFNWADEPQDLTLNLNDYYIDSTGEMYAREYWGGKCHIIPFSEQPSSELIIPGVPPHGVRLFALRPRRPHIPQYLGGNMHISQGLEVTDWQFKDGNLEFAISRPGSAQGRIEIATPRPIKSAQLNEKSIPWNEVARGRYSLDLELFRQARIKVNYE
jgi:alpha-galactosidase